MSDVNDVYGTSGDDVLDGTAGVDSISGFGGNDIISGGQGDDFITDWDGNTILKYNRGDGMDTVALDERGNHIIRFGETITASDLSFVMDERKVGVEIFLNGDKIFNMANMVSNQNGYAIEFADGSSLSADEVKNRAGIYYGTGENDVLDLSHSTSGVYLEGLLGDDVLIGGTGEDVLRGTWGDDVLEGGKGNDSIIDLYGNTIVKYNRGDGMDTVFLGSYNENVIQFGEGIMASDLTLSYDQHKDSILVHLNGEQIFCFETLNYNSHNITMKFTDGSQLNPNEVKLLAGIYTGTSGNDVLDASKETKPVFMSGYEGDDEYISGAGNDFISDVYGNTIVKYNLGDGLDAIDLDYKGNHFIRFGEGIKAADLKYAKNSTGDHMNVYVGDEQILTLMNMATYQKEINMEFADGSVLEAREILKAVGIFKGTDGNDTLIGGAGNDALYGGEGNDYMEGGKGNDLITDWSGNSIVKYNLGDGSDRLNLGSNGAHIVRFGEGIKASDLQFSIGGMDESILVNIGENQILLLENMIIAEKNISIEFADGSKLSAAEIFKNAGFNDATEGDDVLDFSDSLVGVEINGLGGDDIIIGGKAADRLDGGDGDDLLVGGLGDDRLWGGDGNDTFEGGQGNDWITDGGYGNSVVKYNLGDGNDQVWLYDKGQHVIQFGEGIKAEDLSFALGGDKNQSVVVKLGDEQIMYLDGMMFGEITDISMKFADGSVLSNASIVKQFGFYVGTNNNDNMDFADNTTAMKIMGKYGDDIIRAGKGSDAVWGGEGNDKLYGGEGADILYGEIGDDYLKGGRGSDELYGGDGSDFLNGGTGTDFMAGGYGNDIYYIEKYTWLDIINDEGGKDTVLFGDGFASDKAKVSADGNHLVIGFDGLDDKVVIQNYMKDVSQKIETVKFADGTVWDQATLESKLQSQLTQAMAEFAPVGAGEGVSTLDGNKPMMLDLAVAN